MISPPERSPERDAAIRAMLDFVPEHGWTMATLRRALPNPDDAELLFPGGIGDMVETWCDLTDRDMEAAAAEADMTGKGLTKRVHAVIALRFAHLRPHRDSVRLALAVLAMPRNARIAAATAARTVDSIWHAAGDTSADFSWYTKRAILAGVYATTLLYWLRDYSEDDADTLAFLDRRLHMAGQIGRARARLRNLLPKRRSAQPVAA